MGFRQDDVERILVQTGRRCCICKELHSVSVHHIVPTADGGSDDIDNGIPLCPNCHDRVHSGGNPGQVVRKYTASELKLHRQATVDLVFPPRQQALSGMPTATSILKDVSDPAIPLSRCCVEGMELARATGNNDLERFCRDELTGYSRLKGDLMLPMDSDESRRMAYRTVDAYLCVRGFIEPHVMEFAGGRKLMQQIKADPDAFRPLPLVYPEPIATIEVQAPKADPNALIIISINVADFVAGVPRGPEHVRGCYLAGDIHQTVMRSVRAEFTNRLLALVV